MACLRRHAGYHLQGYFILFNCEYLIIGCGISGLTLALELLRKGETDLLLIDKESTPGEHASGRNSGVLHSGVYYSPGSLKAKFCAEGNKLLTEYCTYNNLPLNKCGKVIVSVDEETSYNLKLLKERADSNGVESRLIGKEELGEIEPFAYTYEKALFTPQTAVFDPLKILQCIMNELKGSGKVRFLFNTSFKSKSGDHTVLTTGGEIKYKKLINCAGVFAERIAHQYNVGSVYRILPFIGTYKKLGEEYSHMVNGNIYPVPDLRNPFLGVHFTKSIYGEVYIGPTAIPAPGRESYGIFQGLSLETITIIYRDLLLFLQNEAFRDNAVNEIRKYFSSYVFTEARKMVPELKPGYIEESTKAGIRPQLVNWKNRSLVDDFVVLKDDEENIHVLNAISPAFTSSMSFSRYIVDKYI